MRVSGPHPSDVDGPIHIEAVRWKFYFVSLHSFRQYCGRSLGSLLSLHWSVCVMPRFSLILTDSRHCIFHVSATLVLSHCCRMPIPHHCSQLYYIHWSPPSHFRIMRSISIFFFSLLMIMSVCSLVLHSYLKKKGFVLLCSYLNLPFDLVNCLCLSNTGLFKFMRLDWRG